MRANPFLIIFRLTTIYEITFLIKLEKEGIAIIIHRHVHVLITRGYDKNTLLDIRLIARCIQGIFFKKRRNKDRYWDQLRYNAGIHVKIIENIVMFLIYIDISNTGILRSDGISIKSISIKESLKVSL